MLTAPRSTATRAAAHPNGLVVRFELPDRSDQPQFGQPLDGDPSTMPPANLYRLARAVEDLIRAVAPSVICDVSIEVANQTSMTAGGAQSVQPLHPRLAPAGPATPAPDDPADAQISLDVDGRTLTVDGAVVELTRREFDLLAYLQRHQGQALSRNELMNAVWQTNYLAGDRTVDVHVRRLRVKLGPHADNLITLRGFGYRFDENVPG
jgi:DNA-binding response OmpR family regulator